MSTITQARSLGLNVGLFPAPRFGETEATWWASAARDFSWWITWFERYEYFATHHARLASQANAQALILGGEWVDPALPGGMLEDGTPSNVPPDAEQRWRDLIQQVQAQYSGTLVWALPYPQGVQNPPPFLDEFDQVLILWSAPLASQSGSSALDMSAEALRLFDQDLKPFQEMVGKPIILGVSYPSASGGIMGCVPDSTGTCFPLALFEQPGFQDSQLSANHADQASAYNALLMAINQRDWIGGLVSMGYYPPIPLQDYSTSIHGKTASGVLLYWFPRLLGR